MSFLSPWFLLGLLGVAVPVAIHLSRKQKAEKVVFSSIRFLKKAPQKMIFFQQIQQWLLLLVRAAIIALLAIAFARPYIPQTVAQRAGMSPRSAVILLDTSMSMRYGAVFDRAKAAVLEILDSLQAVDEAAIVTFSEGTEKATELTTDHAQLAALVRNLDSPGFKSTGYFPALRLADQLLRSARYPDRIVFLVSDYQRQAIGDYHNHWRLSPGIAFKGIRIGAEETTNLAITAVTLSSGHLQEPQEHVIIGRVRSLGSRTPSEARVSLLIDEKIVDSQTVDLTDRTEAIVTFRTPFSQRGVRRGAVTVVDEDFAPDNAFYFTVNAQQPLAVLGVADATSDRGPAGQMRWFESALGSGGGASFRLDMVGPGEISGDGLQPYDVVALLDAGKLAPSMVERIRAYVQRGGSLLIAPGSRVAAETFNQVLQGLTPAALDQKHSAANGDFLTITGINRRHPIVRALDLSESGDFGGARFHGYWSTKPVEGSEAILNFDNGAAALLEKKTGRGRVLLFTFSLDTRWSNLPRQAYYVPLVHETLRHLAARKPLRPSYTVGEPVRLHLPAGNAVRVIDPAAAETILTSATGEAVYYRATDRPGYYTVRGLAAPAVLAVNAAPAESDLAFVAPDQLGAGLVAGTRPQPSAPAGPGASIAVRTEKSQRIWWWIILAVIFMGLGETLLANRTYR